MTEAEYLAKVAQGPCPHCAKWEADSLATDKRILELENALKQAADDLEEAADDIADWGAYAFEYFQDKHDLPGTVASTKAKVLDLRKLIR